MPVLALMRKVSVLYYCALKYDEVQEVRLRC